MDASALTDMLRGELVSDADLLVAAAALAIGVELLIKDRRFPSLRGRGLRVRLV